MPSGRSQLWRNPLTNEEHFGVVAAEPGKAKRKVIVDGDGASGNAAGIRP